MKFLYFAVLIVCKCLALDKPKADIRVNVAAQPNQMVRAAGAGAASSAITFPRSGPQHINPSKVCVSNLFAKLSANISR